MDVKAMLKEKGVDFEVIRHEHTYTAQEVAAAEHVTGHMFAKPVVLKAGDEAYMFVLPASRHVGLKQAADLVGKDLAMAAEEDMKRLFADCEIGAEPPFGSPYGVPTYVDDSLAGVDEIVFRAGNHDETIKMSYADYARIENPTVASFAIEEQ
jgi:Ala-tRNA(Pro) deacylase